MASLHNSECILKAESSGHYQTEPFLNIGMTEQRRCPFPRQPLSLLLLIEKEGAGIPVGQGRAPGQLLFIELSKCFFGGGSKGAG